VLQYFYYCIIQLAYEDSYLLKPITNIRLEPFWIIIMLLMELIKPLNRVHIINRKCRDVTVSSNYASATRWAHDWSVLCVKSWNEVAEGPMILAGALLKLMM